MTTERKGKWLMTYTGVKYYPIDPCIEDINIRDIAHCLSLTCRWGGHCKFFYPVAQHCVYAASLLPDEFKLCGLMHDGSEAYIIDVPRSLKPFIKEYKQFEDMNMSLIAQKYDFQWPLPTEVTEVDDRLLETEGRQLLDANVEYIPGVEPYKDFIITPWSPQQAEERFLSMFYTLTN